MKFRITLLLLLGIVYTVSAQKKFTPEQEKVIEFLESKRKEFKAAKNDSVYLAENSDRFYTAFLTRGDQAEDIEEQIFNARPGDVVGPFDGENTFYLLKILKVDSAYRTKAKIVNFFPKGECVTDSVKFRKLVDNYIQAIKKGKDLGKMAIKDQELIGLRGKSLGSFWEGQTKKEYYDLMFERKMDDPYVQKAGQEIQVIYVTKEKHMSSFRVKVIAMVKKLKN